MKSKLFAGIALSLATLFTAFAFAACGDEKDNGKDDGVEQEQSLILEKNTWTYTNAQGASSSLDYGLYVPDSYSATGDKLPLITYIPDSGWVGKTVEDLCKAECPTGWITEENMSKNPAIFLVLTFSGGNADGQGGGAAPVGTSDVTIEGSEAAQVDKIVDHLCETYNIDTNRLYLTGQSMGGIFDWSLNTAQPDKYAATVYVGCQPGDEVDDDMYKAILGAKAFVNQKFVYIASRLDEKAPSGQDAVEAVLVAEGIEYGKDYTLSSTDLEGSSQQLETLFAKNYDHYFVGFPQVANGTGGMEHLRSFAPSYSLTALYNWLLSQSKT